VPQLTKPQVQPTVGPAPSIKDWRAIQTGFDGVYKLLAGLVLYLQTYLTKVYNAVVPTQFIVVTIDNTFSPYTVGATDELIAASAGAAAATVVNLPVATGSGRTLVVKKMDANAQNIAVTPSGTDTIDGANAAVNITLRWDKVRLVDLAAGAWGTW
jgi:hypothetical protein